VKFVFAGNTTTFRSLSLSNDSPNKTPTFNSLMQENSQNGRFYAIQSGTGSIEAMRQDYEQRLNQKENELQTERMNHTTMVERYNTNLLVLESKIKSLINFNDKITKDGEVMRMDHSNFRMVAFSVLQEVKKKIEEFKKYYSTVDDTIAWMKNSYIGYPDAERLNDAKENVKKTIDQMEKLVEERKKYLV